VAEIKDGKIEVELLADRITPGAVRFMEPGAADEPLSVYLKKRQVEALGLPIDEGTKILVVIYSKP
jgi:hypothetical protein